MQINILCGLPRSGKSSLAKKIQEEKGGTILNRDSFRFALQDSRFIQKTEPWVNIICITAFEALTMSNNNIIVDECNITRKSRSSWINSIRERPDIIKIWYLNNSKDSCLDRVMGDGVNPTDQVMYDVICRMSDDFEEPTEDECDVLQVLNNE